MSDNLKRLREQRGAAIKKMSDLTALAKRESRDLSGDEARQHTDAYDQTVQLRVDIAAEELRIERDRSEAGIALRLNTGTTSEELREARTALGAFARTGDNRLLAEIHNRGMNSPSDPDGGYYTVPALSSTMTSRMFDQNPMRRLARVVQIDHGTVWEEPLDLNESSASWVRETATRPATATPKVGLLEIPVNEIYAMQPITQGLLDASHLNLGTWIEGKIADKFARSEGLAFVSGNTPGQPAGFMAAGTDTAGDLTRDPEKLQYVVSGNANTILVDSIRNLYWSMRAPHRKNSTWLMASATANVLDNMKDGDGNTLWRTGMTAGAPPTLLGLPVEFCEDMPGVSAGTFPIALGDWPRGYTIVDRIGMKLLQDPYTSKPDVLFYAYRRVGGNISNADAIKLLKVSA